MILSSHSKIVFVSEVVADGHGHFTVDIELDDGTKAYYPGKEEFLRRLKVGSEVSYIKVEQFAGRDKFKGLTLKNTNMDTKVVAIVTKTSELKKGNNNTYYKEITTEDEVTAIFFSKELNDVESIVKGSLISYTDIISKDNKDIFIGLEKLRRYSLDQARQLSIVRQAAVKAAIDCHSISAPKGKWINKDGSLDVDACFSDVIALAEKFVEYAKVE